MSLIKELFSNRKFQKIIYEFQVDQKISIDNWMKNYYIAASHYHLEQYKKSLEQLHNINNSFQYHDVKNYIAKNYQLLNKDSEAIDFYKQAIELNDKIPGYFNELGNLYSKYLKTNLAVENYTNAIDLVNSNKHKGILQINIGLAFYRVGKIDDAIINFEKSIDFDSSIPNSWLNLGLCYQKAVKHDLAKNAFLTAIKLDPNFFYAYSSLGSTYMDLGNFTQAIEVLKKSLSINSQHSFSWTLLGKVYLVYREYQLSKEAFKNAFVYDKLNIIAVSNYLYSLNYEDKLSDEMIFQEHYDHSSFFFKKDLKKNLVNRNNYRVDKNRKIKIAYVSGDFKSHSVFYFIQPIIKNTDKEKFDIYCLSNNSYSDENTEYLKSNTNFIEIFSMTDQAVAELILNEKIDILIDLSGHTAKNRLSIFSQRLCPIQISWIGYVNYTGIPTIDYRIVDYHTDPYDTNYGEKKLRPNEFFMCYQPPHEYKVSEPPHIKNYYITFGSLNNIYKINNDVIETWSKILTFNKNNKLLLKYHGFGDSSVSDNVKKEFSKHGVNQDQLIFLGRVSQEKHFLTYNKIDIALDTFPHNGATTTCEALWMSTPVVTYSGNSHRSRISHSIVNSIGVPELSKKSKQEYIEFAIELSKDFKKIKLYKSLLREKVLKSNLTEGKTFTKNIENLFTDLLLKN